MARNLVRFALLAGLGTVAACGNGTTETSGSGGSSGTTGGHTGGAGGGTVKLPIGSPCAVAADCGAGFTCLTDHPGGYCSKVCDIKKHDADCPAASICAFDGMLGECHKNCATVSDCRMGGYICSPASTDPAMPASHAFCDAAPPVSDAGTD